MSTAHRIFKEGIVENPLPSSGDRPYGSVRSRTAVLRSATICRRYFVDSSASDWAGQIAGCARSFAEGDFPALGRLFDLSASRLLRYTQAITRSREDAEDAVQGAIVRIARNPRSLAAVHRPWPYLLKVARNEALRIVARKRPLELMAECEAEGNQPPQPLETAERDEKVQQALRRLPSEQAEVVVLKIWENLTFQEIASVTGESMNTVASRYRYALSKLENGLRRVAVDAGWLVNEVERPSATR